MESVDMKKGIAQVEATVRELSKKKTFSVSSIHEYLKNTYAEWKNKDKTRRSLMQILKVGVSTGQLEQVNKFFKLNNDPEPHKSRKCSCNSEYRKKFKKAKKKAKKAKKQAKEAIKAMALLIKQEPPEDEED